MAINKKLRAWVRYDGKNRVVAGSLILQPNQPKVGKWKELPVNKCCAGPNYTLRLLFDDIANANALVGDASVVGNWNTFFDLPAYGNPFTSVVIVGNEVQLTGGSNIEVKFRLFNDYDHLLEVDDDGALVILGDESFGGSDGYSTLTSIIAPNVTTTIGDPVNYGVFGQCYNLANVNLPKCKNLGAVTFYECEALSQSSLVLPFDQITSIPDYAFQYCYGLTEINYPIATSIGYAAFDNCSGVTSIDLPLTTSVDQDAFQQCTGVTSINIPNLITIGPGAFGSCSSAPIFNALALIVAMLLALASAEIPPVVDLYSALL